MNSKLFAAIFFVIKAGIFSSGPLNAASLRVTATTSNLFHLVQEVGGKHVDVTLLCKPTFDPHYIEAKPSLVVAANRSDLVIAVGLGLESSWLPKVLANARNPRITEGQPGYFELGPLLDPIEVAGSDISRAQGDVHPQGNPHVLLDPVRIGKAAHLIAAKLSELDPAQTKTYTANAQALADRFEKKLVDWQRRITSSGHQAVISYHRSLSYFLSRFSIGMPIMLEPLPGVPPTAKHILSVIKTAKAQNVRLILVESYFDASVAGRVAKDVNGMRIATVPVEVGAMAEVNKLDQLIEYLVLAFEGKASE